MAIIGGWKLRYKKPRKPTNKSAVPYEYQRRNDDLKAMGYSSYQQYLKSDDWRIIRNQTLERFPRCLVCPNPASQVHHLNYHPRTLLGMNRYGVVTLCRDCHEKIEFDDAGKKCNLAGANKRLREMAHTAGLHRWLAGGAGRETGGQKKARIKKDEKS